MNKYFAKSQRQTMSLLKGRVSLPGARYFITLRCTYGLTTHPVATELAAITNSVFSGDDASLLCATLMPDHIHLLFRLGKRLSLDRLMAKYKTLTRKIFPKAHVWQRNFFEHHVRPKESSDPYARYIFLNPYRANLIGRLETWPFWIKSINVDFDFQTMLENGRFPPEEWIKANTDELGLSIESIGHD